MREPRPSLLFFTLATLAAASSSAAGGCSRTAPVSAVAPGPAAGIPYLPFPEADELGDDEDTPAPPRPPPPAPLALSTDLPNGALAPLARNIECKGKCSFGAWVPDLGDAKGAGGEPAPTTIWQEELRAASLLAFPRHAELDVVALVLSGSVAVRGDEGGDPKTMGAWSVMRAPGAGVVLTTSGEDATLILAVASGAGSLIDALGRAKKTPAKIGWTKRALPLETRELGKAELLGWGKGRFAARIAFGGDQPERIGVSLLMAAPGAAIPEHDHASSWEHLAILQGAGETALGETRRPVTAGDVLHVPKALRHSLGVGKDSRLVALQIYAPSGPEQRFVQWSKEPK
jgi:quercetin dioxygenase-like cupin family protein